MARYWVADLHLGHGKIAEIRGFDSVEEHDDRIMKQLNRLKTDDHVWVLGDISSGRPEGESAALEKLACVPANLHLIAGNHDSVSSIHRNGFKRQREWLTVFESVQQFGRIKMGGENILMSHYPYARSGDGPGRGPGRYDEYRLPDVGMSLIHGHTHQSTPHMHAYGGWEDELLAPGDSKTRDTNQYCVSWDVHRGLATEKHLSEWILGNRV